MEENLEKQYDDFGKPTGWTRGRPRNPIAEPTRSQISDASKTTKTRPIGVMDLTDRQKKFMAEHEQRMESLRKTALEMNASKIDSDEFPEDIPSHATKISFKHKSVNVRYALHVWHWFDPETGRLHIREYDTRKWMKEGKYTMEYCFRIGREPGDKNAVRSWFTSFQKHSKNTFAFDPAYFSYMASLADQIK
jgi:predicted PilT family ATPase